MTAENSSNTIEISINTDVLVIGAGPAGVEAAEIISAQGYKVAVIGNGEQGAAAVPRSDLVELLDGASIYDFAGVAGDFRAFYTLNGQKLERSFGAVVIAPGYDLEPQVEPFGIGLGDRVVTLSALEEMLRSQEGKSKLAGSTVALLSNLTWEGDPGYTSRVLDAALAIQHLEGAAACIYAGNVKVAGPGLERKFTHVREEGVVCFKPLEKPVITTEGHKIKITSLDSILRQTLEAEYDYLVVEEKAVPANRDIKLAWTLRLDTDLEGFLPSNNVHRFPVKSNREGIYVAAPGLGASIALRIKELFGDGKKTVPADRAVVDPEKCTICLTCYRCCPHGAIFWQDGVAAISQLACQGCGICASECPMDAIQIGGFSDKDLGLQVREAVAATQKQPAIVAFCCQNSALEAGQAAAAFGMDLPPGLKLIKVPCAGKVDVEFIMQAFVEGAAGVMVAACHEGNCKAERGNLFARWRVDEIQKRLAGLGIDKERLLFTTFASNMAKGFAETARDFASSL